MVKSKLALILDSFFISSLITIMLYLWLRHEIKNANLLCFFLILINLLAFGLILFLFFKFNNKKLIKNINEKFLIACMNYLILSDNKTYSTFMCKLFDCKKITTEFYKLEDKFLYINLKSNLNSLNYFEAQELYLQNKINDEKLIFIFKDKEKDFDQLISMSKLNICCLSSEVIIKLMTKKNIYPIEKTEDCKQGFKQKFIMFLKTKSQNITRSHFKEIFFTAISLLFLSLVVPFSNYYLLIGSILLIISIISLFKKDIDTKQDDIDIFK